MGALMGHFSNYGIDQGFIDQVRAKVTPGTSALFLLSSGVVTDRVGGGQGPAVRDHPDQPVQGARRQAARRLRRRVKKSTSRASLPNTELARVRYQARLYVWQCVTHL